MEKTTIIGIALFAILIFLCIALYLGKIDGSTFVTVLGAITTFALAVIAIIVPDRKKKEDQ